MPCKRGKLVSLRLLPLDVLFGRMLPVLDHVPLEDFDRARHGADLVAAVLRRDLGRVVAIGQPPHHRGHPDQPQADHAGKDDPDRQHDEHRARHRGHRHLRQQSMQRGEIRRGGQAAGEHRQHLALGQVHRRAMAIEAGLLVGARGDTERRPAGCSDRYRRQTGRPAARCATPPHRSRRAAACWSSAGPVCPRRGRLRHERRPSAGSRHSRFSWVVRIAVIEPPVEHRDRHILRIVRRAAPWRPRPARSATGIRCPTIPATSARPWKPRTANREHDAKANAQQAEPGEQHEAGLKAEVLPPVEQRDALRLSRSGEHAPVWTIAAKGSFFLTVAVFPPSADRRG